jgi:hypothetical protein
MIKEPIYVFYHFVCNNKKCKNSINDFNSEVITNRIEFKSEEEKLKFKHSGMKCDCCKNEMSSSSSNGSVFGINLNNQEL